jgi:hypothetical protein
LAKTPRKLCAALAGHPDDTLLQARVQIAATAVFLKESIEGGE